MKGNVFKLFIFFIVVFGFVFSNVFIKSRKEYTKSYDFIISRIESDAKGYLTFYDSLNTGYSFTSFRFNEFDKQGFLAGDKVFKDKFSKNVNISRKKGNEYKIFFTQEANGMIPFCLYAY
ncbi:hypothetical protein K6T82_12015 [Flavobacterium sp. 17A]|uniref:Uncharacterized protein n=1 Tax=Flavobacterium potami TaxID=2872310 RepID=A0A9X1KQZ0_9FLAO|nr:hypothetical protein [Flavobacterium potami]MBZ4035497.1 hypothetical protein [Flavobacterium potami]